MKDQEQINRVNWRVDDFCRAHGIGRTYFYDQVACGEIKIIKAGKRTLVPDTEAKAWQERKAAAWKGRKAGPWRASA